MESDISQTLIQLLTGLFYSIPTIVFIAISIYYLLKMGAKTDGILILAGNIIIFLSILIGRVVWIQFVTYQKWEGNVYSYISTAIGVLSFLGSILFAIGTFLLIKRVLKAKSLTEPIITHASDDSEL